MKTIVLTGGGTAGHVSPHLALLPRLAEKGYAVHYIGSQDGIERTLMAPESVTYHAIKTGKLRRYFSWRNFTDPFRVIAGFFQSLSLIRRIRPNAVFSKGGFVAVPVVWAARLCGVPVLSHESDITVGLANRLSMPAVTKIATSFAECAERIGPKAVYTGTPLRPELFSGNREKGLRLCGFDGQKPVLLEIGGSQGARAINEALRAALDDLLAEFDVIHLCGKGNLEPALEKKPGYCQKEFLRGELPDALAAADVVLSRAGSNAIMELLALRKPMLLVPLPLSASRGDQILNANAFARRGWARVLPQGEMTPASLAQSLKMLYTDKDSLLARQRSAPAADGTDRVLALIEAVQSGKREVS